jgi:branched-chain amino acid transport system permease protein
VTPLEQLLTQARRHWRPAVWGVLTLAGIFVPGTVGPYGAYVIAQMAVVAIIVLSLTLLLGLGGQISLAQSAFVGAGAYTAATLERHFGWSLWATLPCALFVGFLLGIVVGIPALRLSGIYLATSTLGLAVVADHLVFQLPQLGGLSGVSLHRPKLPVDMVSNQTFCYLCLGFLALVLFCLFRLREARTGWWLQAIRDDERAAQMAGVDTAIYKLLAFGWSGSLAALGGVLMGYLALHVNPLDFNALTSIGYLAVAIVTGVRRLSGALLAGVLYVVVPQLAGASGPRLAPAFSVVLPLLLVIGVFFLVHGRALRAYLEPRLRHGLA